MSFTGDRRFGEQRAAGRQDVGKAAEHHVALLGVPTGFTVTTPGFTVVMTGACMGHHRHLALGAGDDHRLDGFRNQQPFRRDEFEVKASAMMSCTSNRS